MEQFTFLNQSPQGIGALHAAWVIYDRDQKRVLAARDASGSADMH